MRPFAAGAHLAPQITVRALIARSNRQDVYEAFDARRGCVVVAKVLRPDRRAEPGPRADLLREGELLARLAHPHLVRAYDVHAGERPCVVLETLAGATLEHVIRTARRPLPFAQVALLGAQLASAVGYLHAQGVLHLDLKGANVVIDGPRAKLIDLSHAGPPGTYPAGRGTWCNRAPEQSRGGELGPAADVWGLGVLLHDALTGANPLAELADELDSDDPQLDGRIPPVRAVRPGVPRGLAGLVDACCDPDPAARPPVSALLADAGG